QQVILNLMRNAIEALADVKDDPRRLEIHSHVDDSSVHVTVSDSGPGIPAGIEDQVFHPFITSKDDGLGIGLSVSRSIVEAHGGRLDIKWGSAPMTSFVLTLPLVGQQDHD
ncbi:MAG: ATP-binding protein, partial [Gammaproteobacteria bacterium]